MRDGASPTKIVCSGDESFKVVREEEVRELDPVYLGVELGCEELGVVSEGGEEVKVGGRDWHCY